MAIWQWALLSLALVWGLQSLGVWLQMRHYSDVFKGITQKYADGFVGAGNHRGRFARGTIVLVVVTPDLIVRRLLVMSGRSVFAKFKRHEEYEGVALDRIRSNPAIKGEGEPGVAEAVKRAIEQIDRARSEPGRKPGLAGLKTVSA
ncbi:MULTISPECIES: transcriptional regulator GutM [Phyllobacteriaceae]|jgi:glucitol operon activator protein|uniref:Transcriptional regulator n=1 Tax=Mesorhizobium hungaricum TaxID=1566387 RepID=A0A1C2DVF4_9HYPH|nr:MULTISPECIES: transcriptional regulator GutM [Mesorhizobium]MBN9234077.1 transcriptional regulator [Mesorhizobium sp.]MDQ0331612.1 glucitol operon activator protein [Mesorhizobium sp. YL-MeA3-2017]OCX18770.1 transcriptional regulator [Mesorhizobium hungaricum]